MGQSIRFPEDQVRPMGRATMGVKAIDLADDDQVVGIARDRRRAPARARGLREGLRQAHAASRSSASRTAAARASSSSTRATATARSSTSRSCKDGDEVMLITDHGQTLRTRVEEIRETGRNAQGVKIMNVDDDERVVAIEPINEGQNDAPLEGEPEEAPEESAAAEPEGPPTAESDDQDTGDGG